jgi:hypothetical protein
MSVSDAWQVLWIVLGALAGLGWMLWTWLSFYRQGHEHGFERGVYRGQLEALRKHRRDLDAMLERWKEAETLADVAEQLRTRIPDRDELH